MLYQTFLNAKNYYHTDDMKCSFFCLADNPSSFSPLYLNVFFLTFQALVIFVLGIHLGFFLMESQSQCYHGMI